MQDDLISRQTVKRQMIKYGFHAHDMTVTEFVEDLPSVNPQKSKIEPRYCDRNICLRNEYNNIGCDECEVTKSQSQESCEDIMNRILNRMWNCRGKHTTSIDKVKMEQILRDELPSDKEYITQSAGDEIRQKNYDLISRQAVLDITWEEPSYTDALNVLTEVRDKVKELPSVNPQEKTGHWIDSLNRYFTQCSECGLHGAIGIYKNYGWCPKCGAKMIELYESEE